MIIKYKGELHHAIETPLGITAGEKWKPDIPVPEMELQGRFNVGFPKIPYALFLQIAKWQTEIALEHRCEAATSLFLINNEWVAVPFYQENNVNCMTIDVDFTTPENAALMEQYAGGSLMGMHATLHNHVNGGAGQSGTDMKDERNLFGPHITIGNLNSKQMSFHARMSLHIGGKHQFVELRFLDIIDVQFPFDISDFTEEQITGLEKLLLNVDRKKVADYPAEWKDRFALKVFTNLRPLSGAGNQTAFRFGSSTGGELKDADEIAIAEHPELLTTWPSQVAFFKFDKNYKKWDKWLDDKAPEMVREALVALCFKHKVDLKTLHKSMCEALEKKEPQTKEEPVTK